MSRKAAEILKGYGQAQTHQGPVQIPGMGGLQPPSPFLQQRRNQQIARHLMAMSQSPMLGVMPGVGMPGGSTYGGLPQ